jgi:hypothetical protein
VTVGGAPEADVPAGAGERARVLWVDAGGGGTSCVQMALRPACWLSEGNTTPCCGLRGVKV